MNEENTELSILHENQIAIIIKDLPLFTKRLALLEKFNAFTNQIPNIKDKIVWEFRATMKSSVVTGKTYAKTNVDEICHHLNSFSDRHDAFEIMESKAGNYRVMVPEVFVSLYSSPKQPKHLKLSLLVKKIERAIENISKSSAYNDTSNSEVKELKKALKGLFPNFSLYNAEVKISLNRKGFYEIMSFNKEKDGYQKQILSQADIDLVLKVFSGFNFAQKFLDSEYGEKTG